MSLTKFDSEGKDQKSSDFMHEKFQGIEKYLGWGIGELELDMCEHWAVVYCILNLIHIMSCVDLIKAP